MRMDMEGFDKKALFVYNPFAGKALINGKLSQVMQKFCEAGYAMTVYATQGPKFATELVKEQGEDYDLIVCSGGDGTLNEVITGVMALKQRPVIGYIPAGTVNDFASSLKIPKKIMNAVDVIINGEAYQCDIGSFNEKNFNYIAGFGAFTEVSYETPQNMKNAFGRMAYLIDGAKRLPSLKGYQMCIEHSGEVYQDEFIYGMITNSKSVGGFKLVNSRRKVKLDDGLFECVFVRMPKNPLDLERTMNAILAREVDERYLYAFRSRDIRVMGAEEVQWTLDGESGGYQKEVHVVNNHKAITIMRPKKKK